MTLRITPETVQNYKCEVEVKRKGKKEEERDVKRQKKGKIGMACFDEIGKLALSTFNMRVMQLQYSHTDIDYYESITMNLEASPQRTVVSTFQLY